MPTSSRRLCLLVGSALASLGLAGVADAQSPDVRAAIQKVMQGLIDAGAKELPLATVEVEAHGDTAWEVGTWTLKGKDGAELDHGKSVAIWKKEAGGWKLHRDIWNSSQAPAP
jgi:ketosteroid isomerase-like protein